MAICSKCGASLDPNSQFCPGCGSAQANAPNSNAPMSTSTSTSTSVSRMTRPTGVTVLAALAFLGGVILLGFGLLVGSAFSALFSLVGLGGIGSIIEVVFIVFALIQFAIGYGYWVGASWAWWLGFIGAILDIVSIIALNIFGLIIGIVMAYYLTRPHVKMWFHQG